MTLLDQIKKCSAHVGVIGLGYPLLQTSVLWFQNIASSGISIVMFQMVLPSPGITAHNIKAAGRRPI